MTHSKLSIAILIIALFGLFPGVIDIFSSTAQAAEEKKASEPKPALTVAIVQPLQGNLTVKLAANGNIAAWQEALIGSEAAGLRLSEVRVGVGDLVRAGQVLATFATATIQADLAQTSAALMEAQANAQDAAAVAARARSVDGTGALSAQQISQYLTAEQTAKARVESVKAQLEMQQLRLKQTQVLAPDSGVISSRSATVGAVVGNGTELFRMIRKGRLEWRGEVTASELGRIPVGTTVQITAASGAQVKGRVRMIGPTVDPQTRAALVYVDLPGAGPSQGAKATSGGSEPRAAGSVGARMLAGMFARGEFELGQTAAMTVPQTAVVMRDGFAYVYLVGAGNRVAQVKVQIGRVADDRIEILSPLAADARLVAQGAGFLNDGDLVRIAPDSMQNKSTALVKPAQSATK